MRGLFRNALKIAFCLIFFHSLAWADHGEKLQHDWGIPKEIAFKLSDIIHNCQTYARESENSYGDFHGIPVVVITVYSVVYDHQRVGEAMHDTRNRYLLAVRIDVPQCGSILWKRNLSSYPIGDNQSFWSG